jgi:hypothetical protein
VGRSGNGEGPGGGTPDDLPDLPPDWGSVVIPDDPSELAVEAELVRRDLRRTAGRARWRRRLGLTPVAGGPGRASVGPPLMLVLIAVVATATGLCAMFWPGSQRLTGPRPAGIPATDSAPGRIPGQTLPAVELVDEKGDAVSLRGLLPAVIILVDGCDCAGGVGATARVAPTGLTVIALTTGRSVPIPVPSPPPIAGPATAPVRALADPAAELRTFLQTPARPGGATAVLVARSGEVARILPAVTSVDDFRADLPQLVTR